MRVLSAALAGASLALVLVVAPAGAATSRTYCQKAVRADRGTVDGRSGGVTVWHRGLVYSACSDSLRKRVGLLIVDKGTKASLVRGAGNRCMAILFTAKGKLPRILLKDLGGKQAGASMQVVGYGGRSATVGSLAVAANCAAAWGQTVARADGTSTSVIVARGFGSATSIGTALSELALVAGSAETTAVGIVAAGAGVTVTWSAGGSRQTASLP